MIARPLHVVLATYEHSDRPAPAGMIKLTCSEPPPVPQVLGQLVEEPVHAVLLAAADGDDDGAIHGDDVNRAFRAAFVGVVARWSSRCRVVVGEVPGRRRHGGAGLRTCEGAA
jgi:hypothetical protein